MLFGAGWALRDLLRIKQGFHPRVQAILCGNLESSERVEIRNEGALMGNLATRRIYIEEGAVLSGSIDVHKPSKKEKAEVREEPGIELEGSELDRKDVVSFPVTELVEEIAS